MPTKKTAAEQAAAEQAAAEQAAAEQAAAEQAAAEQAAAEQAAAEQAAAGPRIADGQSVTSLRGVLNEGDAVDAECFVNGQADFDRLVEAGVIVK